MDTISPYDIFITLSLRARDYISKRDCGVALELMSGAVAICGQAPFRSVTS